MRVVRKNIMRLATVVWQGRARRGLEVPRGGVAIFSSFYLFIFLSFQLCIVIMLRGGGAIFFSFFSLYLFITINCIIKSRGGVAIFISLYCNNAKRSQRYSATALIRFWSGRGRKGRFKSESLQKIYNDKSFFLAANKYFCTNQKSISAREITISVCFASLLSVLLKRN